MLMYSALKKDGRPLYEYARAGQTVERAARRVVIHELALLSCDLPQAPVFAMRVTCSKGTYIRTLAEDIGEALGCGAHLSALRRTAVGDLTLAGAVTLEQLGEQPDEARPAMLAPVDALLQRCMPMVLDDAAMGRFLQGQRIAWRDLAGASSQDDSAATDAGATDAAGNDAATLSAPPEASLVRVYGGEPPRLLGVGRMREGALRPERLVRI